MMRVQRKRGGGWRMPENTIYVGRPTQWGNYCDSLEEFERYATERAAREPGWLAPLRGKNLACWCRPEDPCHSKILLHLANK